MDISAPHLAIAKEYLHRSHVSNVDLKHVDGFDALDSVEPVDVMFSFIVLQHNPPPIIAYSLRKLLRCVKPGGVAFFQVPTYCQNYRFIAEEYLSQAGAAEFEMHLLPQPWVHSIAASEGCVLLEMQPDHWVGDPAWISNTFLFHKR